MGVSADTSVFLVGAQSVRVGIESRLAKPSRSDVLRAALDVARASWTIRAEEDGTAMAEQICS